MNHRNNIRQRPIINIEDFEKAFEMADLTESEKELIDYIRYVGTFTQVGLAKELGLPAKPPILSELCKSCRKIGEYMPIHFKNVREWSREVSEDGVRWDGDLICSIAYNIDGERLSPEAGTTQYHTFVVHKELFRGLE